MACFDCAPLSAFTSAPTSTRGLLTSGIALTPRLTPLRCHPCAIIFAGLSIPDRGGRKEPVGRDPWQGHVEIAASEGQAARPYVTAPCWHGLNLVRPCPALLQPGQFALVGSRHDAPCADCSVLAIRWHLACPNGGCRQPPRGTARCCCQESASRQRILGLGFLLTIADACLRSKPRPHAVYPAILSDHASHILLGSLQFDGMPDSRLQDPRISSLLLDHGANPTDHVETFGFGGGANGSNAKGPDDHSEVVRGARPKSESWLC